jgi:hypothetical protein
MTPEQLAAIRARAAMTFHPGPPESPEPWPRLSAVTTADVDALLTALTTTQAQLAAAEARCAALERVATAARPVAALLPHYRRLLDGDDWTLQTVEEWNLRAMVAWSALGEILAALDGNTGGVDG